jgi:trehalose synthase-fused probable maltokinase
VTRERIGVWLTEEFSTIARNWLPAQRWFGGKARRIEAVHVEDVIWLPPDTTMNGVVVLRVGYAGAERDAVSNERYAMVVGVVTDPKEHPTIAPLTWAPGLQVVEATTDGPVLLALLQGLVDDVPLRGERGGSIVYADATSAARTLVASDSPVPRVAPVGLEQSNTSVRIGATHVFKLFRRLEDGENPQLEIGRFLRRTPFRAVPPLEGSLVYLGPGGDKCALGALEGWVDNLGDGWRHVLAQLQRAWHEPEVARALTDDMRVLGATTADFHVALASDTQLPAFAPEPATPLDSDAWLWKVRAQAERTMALIERHIAHWPEPLAALGRPLLGAGERSANWLGAIENRPHEAFQKIRIHGDFHLGQTLKTTRGFAIIDFEGEPAKPLAERRQKHCVLKDVAGLVRSLDYAAATARPHAVIDRANGFAVSDLRQAFVGAYRARARAQHVTFLPPSPATVDEWLRVFELEKALYEVEYEVNNRPDWVHIPLGAVERLLGGAARPDTQPH